MEVEEGNRKGALIVSAKWLLFPLVDSLQSLTFTTISLALTPTVPTPNRANPFFTREATNMSFATPEPSSESEPLSGTPTASAPISTSTSASASTSTSTSTTSTETFSSQSLPSSTPVTSTAIASSNTPIVQTTLATIQSTTPPAPAPTSQPSSSISPVTTSPTSAQTYTSTSTLLLPQTSTSTTFAIQSSNSGSPNGFFANTGAVIGIFTAIGVVIVALSIALCMCIWIRRRSSLDSRDFESIRTRESTLGGNRNRTSVLASDYENASTREQSLRSQTRIQRRSSSVLSGGSHSRAPPSYASHPNRRNHQGPTSSPASADRRVGAIEYDPSVQAASDYDDASNREQPFRSQMRNQRRIVSNLSGGSHSNAPPSYATHPNRRNHQRPSSSPACADRHAGAITYSVPPDVRESFYREQN